MPLDYLYSTSQNLNNRITVGGGALQYSDLMFNILANPPLIHSAYFTLEGTTTQVSRQEVLAMQFLNKNAQGYKKIDPVNLSLKIDTMQVFNNVIAFDLHESLNRPFIPDGMDVINYTIYAGVKATLVFFYEQIHIKDVYYDEARKSKILL
jgi:subtilase family serine protease